MLIIISNCFFLDLFWDFSDYSEMAIKVFKAQFD